MSGQPVRAESDAHKRAVRGLCSFSTSGRDSFVLNIGNKLRGTLSCTEANALVFVSFCIGHRGPRQPARWWGDGGPDPVMQEQV